ncbi:DUF3489 domain-containing protein [Sphingobium sp.]|uniref:DUF3489 domain-containing protein n=1 Tax=Sphingobium sp. TaxID=1912891 RepID=UPI002BC82A40|nr:DUF3489 domain-containing protein [Sphingobium sp.]HUD91654.1 DUF3489 domain-containing protein [Sphingobium sp.]
MPRKTHLNDLDLILLSTASAREEGHLHPLKSSIAGRADDVSAAIAALLKRRLIEKAQVSDLSHTWKTEGDTRIGLVITAKARALIDGVEIADETIVGTPPSVPPRVGLKTEAVLALLRREEGASSAELIDATGWLPHSMRAALTGLRRKGHAIERGVRGDLKVYRLIAGA